VDRLKRDGGGQLRKRIEEVQSLLGRSSESARAKAMEKFDETVAGECIFCGDLMVKSIDSGFAGERNEMDSWKI
jgi:hypothetical protein